MKVFSLDKVRNAIQKKAKEYVKKKVGL